MGKCAIYARVSTVDKQDYKRQVSDCITAIGDKYTTENIEIFAEQISGYKKKELRPQLTKLIDIIENDSNHFDIIYITEISRLGRDPKETRNLIDNLTEKKIPIHITSINRKTLDDNGERDSIMNIIIQVLIEFADSESKTMKKRSRSGMLESAKVKGNAGGGLFYPYGYRKDETKKLVINDNEAEIIKDIFNYYKEGNGCKKIAGILNNRNIPTRTNIVFEDKFIKNKKANDIVWVDKVVYNLIRNPIYKGDRRYKDEIIKAPAIISSQLFDECNDIMENKTHRNYLTSYTYILKDLLICGCCGRKYFARFQPSSRGLKVYMCSSRIDIGGNCGNVGINISLIESAIYNEIVNSPNILEFLGDKDIKKELKSKINSLDHNLKTNQNIFDKLENRKKRLLELYEIDGLSPERYLARNEEINKEENELANKIDLVKNELFENQKLLAKQDDKKATTQMLIDAKGNRTLLATLFKQFIKKIVIEPYNKNNALISLYPSINGIEKPYPLRMILDLYGLRLKQTQYRYRPYYMAYEGDEDPEDFLTRLNDIDSIIDKTPLKTITDNLVLIEDTYPSK